MKNQIRKKKNHKLIQNLQPTHFNFVDKQNKPDEIKPQSQITIPKSEKGHEFQRQERQKEPDWQRLF